MYDNRKYGNDEITKEIIQNYGILSKSNDGWAREANLVSWNKREPKLDVRQWSPDHDRCGKGMTLTKEEAAELQKAIDLFLVDTTAIEDGLLRTVTPEDSPF